MNEFETAIIPVLTVRKATKAVEFYRRAFGAEEIRRNWAGYPNQG